MDEREASLRALVKEDYQEEEYFLRIDPIPKLPTNAQNPPPTKLPETQEVAD